MILIGLNTRKYELIRSDENKHKHWKFVFLSEFSRKIDIAI